MTEEIDLMLQIGNHKNIIKLHGICYYLSKLQDIAGPPPYPVLEYAECGNLRTFLRFQRNIGNQGCAYTTTFPVFLATKHASLHLAFFRIAPQSNS